MSNNNQKPQQQEPAVNINVSSNEPIMDRAWNFTKSIAKPAVAGAAGIGLAYGAKALWTRAATKTTESAVASAVNSGGSSSPF
jgi:hypothetical protein